MQCERVAELIGPYMDGELEADDRRFVAAHLDDCPECRRLLEDYRSVGRLVAARGHEPVPAGFAGRLSLALAREAAVRHAETGMPARTDVQMRRPDPASVDEPPVRLPRRLTSDRLPTGWKRWTALAAALVFACVLSATAASWLTERSNQVARLEQDLMSAHVRSQLQDLPYQVASADTHTVKPWLVGRVDFAPEVRDLAADGFTLLGGRLDYVGGRRVGVIVYKRRLHFIDVFVWPHGAGEPEAPSPAVVNGYNMILWTKAGFTYAAVSDMNGAELQQLQGLL
jgi:anti-sigma factor RsiW